MTTSTDRYNGLIGSVAIKPPVIVATTENITLSGLQTIDGVTLVENNRVLVKNQSSAIDNGIWIASSGAWTRATDFNGAYDVAQGTAVIVAQGTTNSNTIWYLDTVNPIVGTSNLSFTYNLIDSSLLITSTGSSAPRSLADRFSDTVNVKDFGAVGDDSTDDSAAIQAAIDYAGAQGGTRSRALYFPRGVYRFTQLTIDNDYTGLTFLGDGFFCSNLSCTAENSNPAIVCQAQEFKLLNISLISSIDTPTNIANGKRGLQLDKGVGQSADIDATIQNCRIAGFYNDIYIRGRGLICINNILSSAYNQVELDWYDTADYVEGSETSQKDATGFRGHIFIGNKFPNHSNAAISNVGSNASKLNGLTVVGANLDIGRRLFHGDLGQNALIDGIVCDQSPDEIFQLTGGQNYLISNIVCSGDAIEGRIGENLIKISGEHINGVFTNLQLSDCEQHAILIDCDDNSSISFDNINFRNVCSDGATFKPIAITSENCDYIFNNIKYIGSTAKNAIIDNNFSNNEVRINNVQAVGSSTPINEGNVNCYNYDIANASAVYRQFFDDDDYATPYAQFIKAAGAFQIQTTGRIVFATDTAQVRPLTDNTYTLGFSTARWSVIYAGTGTINTSDYRNKQDVQLIHDQVLDAWGDVNWCSFRFKDVVKEKGDKARYHVGLIAQQVKDVFEMHNLDPFRLGILCYDVWEEEIEFDKKGNIISKIPAGNLYGIRYEEALALEAMYVRRELNRIKQKEY